MYTYKYPRPAVTVDALIFTLCENRWKTLLIKRKHDPFEGMWAIPGGFMDMDETLEAAAKRELEEETALRGIALQQLHTFSTLGRDPRHRTITTVFYGFMPTGAQVAVAGDDAGEAEWFYVDELPTLAFDHEEVLQMAIEKLLHKKTDAGAFSTSIR